MGFNARERRYPIRIVPRPAPQTRSFRLLRPLALAIAVCSPATGEEKGAPAPPARLAGLPERFFQVQDAAGFLWQALDSGALVSGDAQYLQSGLNLIVDGEPFAPKSGETREPGSGAERIEIRLEEERAGYALSRDLWFDTARSGVRVFDTITNPGKAELRLPVALRTTYPFAWQSLHGTGGRVLASDSTLGLGPADVSLGVHFSPSDGRHDTLFLLGSEKGGSRPELKASANSRELVFLYSLAIPAGGSRSLLHWILQRNLPEAAQDVAAIAPFLQRGELVAPGVEPKRAESLVNFVPAAFPAEAAAPARQGGLVALNDLCSGIGLYRRAEDLLRLGPSSQVAGTLAREGSIRVGAPPLGEVDVKTADLAAVRGGGGQGGTPRWYLRDGRVLAGALAGGALLWKDGEGKANPIDPAEFHLLLLATEARDGTPPAGATHFAELANGAVLAVVPPADAALEWIAPWGRERLPWSDLAEALRQRRPGPRFRLLTGDGSLFSALIDPKPLDLETAGGKRVELAAVSLERIWRAGEGLRSPNPGPARWLDFSELPDGIGPATGALLEGDELLACELAPGSFALRDGATVVAIDSARIVAIRRPADPEAGHLLTVATGAGESFTGEAAQAYLGLKRANGADLEIATERLLAFRKGGPRR